METAKLKEFTFDPNVELARTIYRGAYHQVTNLGVGISAEATAELRRFMREYATFLGADKPFFRLDVYMAGRKLWVLEVNTAFVDGWGTALNLSRAAGLPVATDLLWFPKHFCLLDEAYRPELELLVSELGVAGKENHHICEDWKTVAKNEDVYAYGRTQGHNIWPKRGVELDNKMNLQRFRVRWHSELIAIPRMFTPSDTVWADVPSTAFLKFTDKSGSESQRARFSVKAGKPAGSSPFLKRCYNDGTLIAQERIDGRKTWLNGHDRQIQLVVLGNTHMLTGYVQYGLGSIVNDNSIHGPLAFTFE